MANQIVVSAGAKVRNLDGVLTGTSGVVNSLPINASNGIPQLDVNGKILVSQLPNSVMEYQGVWNANTNNPTLTNGGAFNQGDVYLCNVAGTTNFGAGPISFIVGDQAIYSGTIWQKAGGATGTVTSVAVTESGDSLNITGSPITTSGTINIGFNGTNLQYVNGAGNLTTFPILTGYVPYTGATANLNLGIYSFIANDGAYNTEMSPSYFGVENAAGTIFGLLEYNKLTLTNSTGAGSTMIVNAQGLIFPDASVQTSSYTDAKARLALSLTTTGTSGVATYNNATGVFNIPNYGSGLSGYVPYTGATQDVDLGAFKLNAQSLHIKGTAGNGHLGLKHQSASATASANEVSLFADSLGDLSWLNGNLYLSKFITSGNTAARSYTFPDASCNIPNDSLVVHLAGTETITGAKTFSGGVTFTSSLTTNNLTFANSGFFLTLQPPTLSVNRTVTLPNGTGTLALTSDISYPVTSVFGRTGAVVATSGDYTTAQVTESGNLYFTDSRARLALSFAAGSGAYNSTTGVITIPTNNNQITNGANYITLSSLSFVAGSGAYNNTTGVITIPTNNNQITNGAGYTTNVGTVTSVAALTIGTSGTDLSSSVANSTTTPVITLNVPTASATNRGALSSTDWSTFNNKQNALTNPVTGTGTTNYLPKFTGASTIGNSAVFESGGNVSIGNTSPINNTISGFDALTIGKTSSSSSALVFTNGSSTIWGFNYANASKYTFSSSTVLAFETGASWTQRMLLDASGNLGLGVTPSAWRTAYDQKSIQFGPVGFVYSLSASETNNQTIIGSNYYVNTSGTGVYIKSDAASSYQQYQGGHYWNTAPSGTAGAAITFTQAMTLNASGNLSVGNTNDTYRLDVTGRGRFTHTAGVPALDIRASDSNFALMSVFGNQTGDVNWLLMSGYPNAGDFTIRQSDVVNALTLSKTTGAATFSSSVTANSQSTFNYAGKDGLIVSDTTTQAAGVGGSILFKGVYTNGGSPISFGRISLMKENSTNADYSFGMGFYTSANNGSNPSTNPNMYIAGSGNVGIGTTSPATILDVNAGTSYIRSYNNAAGWNFYALGNFSSGGQGGIYTGAGYMGLITDGSYSLTLGTNNTERMRITSDGNLLVGTTDNGSGAKLVFYSTSAAQQLKAAGTAPAITFTNTITSATIGGSLGACTSANQFLTGTAAGDMIFINQFAGNKLYITNYSGGVYLSQGATSWTANSDIRLKNINSYIENAVEKLSTLQTINFSYKDDTNQKQNLGLIAQEVEKMFPELIDKNNEGMLGVRYTELIPVLIKAVQELKAEIETLKK